MAVWLKTQMFCDVTLCVGERKVSQSFDDFCAFIFRINCEIKKNSLNLEDEGNTFLLHVNSYSVKNSACQLRKSESSEIQFLCPD
jgi:hypothetical protein